MLGAIQTHLVASVLLWFAYPVAGREVSDQRRLRRNSVESGNVAESTSCYDIPDWSDSTGENYDCEYYAARGDDYCVNTGDLHGNMGLTANTACCACGGGLMETIPMTSAVGWQLFVHRDVYFWAVSAVELYSSEDCGAASRIVFSVDTEASFFDSGHKDPQGPERPFLAGKRWPGRKDAYGNFYLGVQFATAQTVRCIRLNQNGQGTPDIMILAKESATSEWTNIHYATGLSGGWSTIPLTGELPSGATLTSDPVTTPATSPNTETMANAIEVPATLVPSFPNANQDSPDIFCRYLDLSSIQPPANPGYGSETIGSNSISGDDIWATSFYMMLYANCERQVRGVQPFAMWSNDIMLQLQSTYIYESGHTNFGDRVGIITTAAAEGAGGAPLIGNEIPPRKAADDTILNREWDPLEAARVAVAGLVNHGDALRDPNKKCVFATVTLGPTDNDWMSAILLYGNGGC